MIERIESEFYIEYRSNGTQHRPNGPALIWNDGDWSWWMHGNRHRYYGVAFRLGVTQEWILHGVKIK